MVKLKKAGMALIDVGKICQQFIGDILRIECAEYMQRKPEGVAQIPEKGWIISKTVEDFHIFSHRGNRGFCSQLHQTVVIRSNQWNQYVMRMFHILFKVVLGVKTREPADCFVPLRGQRVMLPQKKRNIGVGGTGGVAPREQESHRFVLSHEGDNPEEKR